MLCARNPELGTLTILVTRRPVEVIVTYSSSVRSTPADVAVHTPE